jgi:hypothetical protein
LAVGVALALGALVGLHDVVLGAMDRVEIATSSSTAGRIQIAMGVLALVIAAAITVGFSVRRPVAVPAGAPLHQAEPTAFTRLSTRALQALRAGPPWITFLVGVGITTDFRYLAALTVILASGAALSTQVSAAAAYTLIGLAFAEVPLICQLVAPARTGAMMSRVHDWVQARRRAVLGAVVAVLGLVLMTTGLGHV